MEPLFAVRSIYDEAMFYNQVAASTPKKPVEKEKKFRLPDIRIQDVILLPVMFAIFYVSFGHLATVDRAAQSVLAAIVAWVILKYINKRNGDAKEAKVAPSTADSMKQQARALLENSCLAGERCTMRFFEDGFQVENSGITTWYKYEGIAWIKETPKYVVIFWNRSLAIPVEKAGFYRGSAAQFPAFLEKRCQKVIEKVRVAG